MRKGDGTYEARDLIETKNLYNNNGSTHTRQENTKSLKGNKLINTSPGDRTIYTLNIGSYNTLFNCIATINTNGQEYDMRATVKSINKNTGDITFVIWHPNHTNGNLPIVLNYIIDVI